MGKYSYGDAFIESVYVTDVNNDDLVDVIIKAANTGRNLLVSQGVAPNGKIIWETHALKGPGELGLGGC